MTSQVRDGRARPASHRLKGSRPIAEPSPRFRSYGDIPSRDRIVGIVPPRAELRGRVPLQKIVDSENWSPVPVP